MTARDKRQRHLPWQERKRTVRHWWMVPFHVVEHGSEWLARHMRQWVVLEALEYLGRFSVLVAVIFYFAESGDRQKQKHYQAWQVINTAQGKGGSGGRIEALHELNSDHVPLVGVVVSGAFLQGVRLERANLLRADFEAADLRNSVLRRANLMYANLTSANFRDSHLERANLEGASLEDADLNGANLAEAKLDQATLEKADLRNADLRGMQWSRIRSIRMANLHGVRNAPKGFLDWARKMGAVAIESDDAWNAQLDSGK